MKKIEILLRDNVPTLGRCGDVVAVSAGYARNFLLPRRMAVAATLDNVKMMQRRKARLDIEEAALMADIESKTKVLAGLSITTAERADDQGHLFGSVNAATIARLLAEKGLETDEKHVRLDLPIKTIGTHEVLIHVHGEHTATVSVEVTSSEA
ncbi:MAG: large subunit ribosomal protein L9 [Planctomycetota bacterium]|jgi:large subunit ribosomal protein L9